MKTLKILTLILLLFTISAHLYSQEQPDKRNIWTGGQKGYVITGDLSVIKGQKTFNVVLDPHIKRMGLAEAPDSIYMPKKVSELNEKNPGSGDKWLQEYVNARVNFKAAFIEGFNSRLKDKGVQVGPNDTAADYSFYISTKALSEFMGDIYIILDINVVKTADTSQIVAAIRCPLNNSKLKSKLYKSKYERAYFGAGVLFGKYCFKNIF